MKILIVKLSSLGDVVHAMPAVQDLLAARPDAVVDWVVERAFAPLVERCRGVSRAIPCELRRWRGSPLAAATRAEWRAFRADLRRDAYDLVIDLQGLAKSALVARMARLAPGGERIAMANRTEGSSYEAPTRWVADRAVAIEPRVSAVERSRRVVAATIGVKMKDFKGFGLLAQEKCTSSAIKTIASNEVAFIHGSSRRDKCWPESHWIELGRRMIESGSCIGLPHGDATEEARANRVADALGRSHATVWSRADLAPLTDRLAVGAGAIGVDSGLSHIAVALGVPHVQIYNHDTAWRTGPAGDARQVSVFAAPWPTVDAVASAWRTVSGTVNAETSEAIVRPLG